MSKVTQNHGQESGEKCGSSVVEKDINSRERGLRRFNERRKGEPFPFAGIVVSLIGSFFFSLTITFVKLLPDSQGFEEKIKIVALRGGLMMIFCTITSIWNGTSLLVARDELWVNVARAVFGTLGMAGSFCSLKYISPGETMALVFCSPVLTSILCYFVFKEPLHSIQLLVLPVCMVGVILIAKPTLIISSGYLVESQMQEELVIDEIEGNIEHRLPGILMALGVSVALSFTYIALKIRKKTPINATTFWLGVCLLLSSLATMSFIGFGSMPSTSEEWLIIFGIGLSSYAAQLCMQWSFLYESASVLAIISSSEVALTFLVSAILLQETIYWTSFVGATLIVLVVVTIMVDGMLRTPTNGTKVPEQERVGEQTQVKVE